MGCGGSKEAPYLRKYYEWLEKHTKTEMKTRLENPMALLELAFDPEKMKAEQEKNLVKIKKNVVPLIEKSFDHHDTKKNGILDEEESQAFFQHFVEEHMRFSKVVGEMILRASMDQTLRAFAAIDPKMKKDMEKQMKPQIEG